MAATPTTEEQDGLPSPRRYWSVAGMALAVTMAVLDGAIANVALPTISRDLGADAATSIWVINAYQLAVTVSLLPFAALGDRLGYRRVYLAGLAVFTLGSLACALSHSLMALVIARVFQGLGGAAIMSINPALIRFTYPQRLLGRGIGINAVIISLASALGPTIAAAILAAGPWPWLFAVNGPIGLAAFLVGLRSLPKTPPSEHRFDVVSTLLNAAAFGFLIFGAESIAREGFGEGIWKLAIGAVAAVALIWREAGRPAPLVPIDLVRIPLFGLSVATSIVSFAAQMLAFVALPFFFQGPLGRTAVETGLLMTPWPLAVAVAAPISGRLADRYPPGLLGAIGLGILAIGLYSLTSLGPGSGVGDIVWRMALCGFGFGIFQSPNNRAMLGSAPRWRSGAAGGMLATARLLGQTTGAVAMAVFFHLFAGRAMAAAFASAAVAAAAAALISLTRLRIPAQPPAQTAPARTVDTTHQSG